MLDSSFERLAPAAMANGIRPGHYRLRFAERLKACTVFVGFGRTLCAHCDRTWAEHERFASIEGAFGPGRVFIEDLARRDVTGLLADEKAEATLDDHRVRIANRIATIGLLRGFNDVSIHGGGESLSYRIARSNFQPLTPPERGVRIHNAELEKLLDFLEPRLRTWQVIVLTICG